MAADHPRADGPGARAPATTAWPEGLLARVAAWAEATPDAIAIDAGATQVTYRALARHAVAVARALGHAGVGPGGPVAVRVASRSALVGATLGVLRAGALFAPLDADATEERIRRQIDWLEPAVVLHDGDSAALARLATDGTGRRALLRVPDHDVGGIGDEPLAPDPPARGSGYVYFTSGSTGRPKATLGSWESLARRIEWEIAAFAVGPGTRVSQLITPTFDPWLRDVFVPLCAGGTICVPPEPPFRMDPGRLLEWLRDARVELVHCGPTLMATLVSVPAKIRRFPALRVVLTSGETLHVSLVTRWRRRFGRRLRLVNLYGSTEATMFQLAHVVGREDIARGFIPVGGPLPGVSVRVVDAHGRRCAPGEVGELLIGGASLSRGYYRDEAATAKAFVHVDGGVHYRTGDLGVEFEPGLYRLIGRVDDEVKIRGVRVNPGDVEDTLLGYPLIASCAVVARPNEAGDPSLVAYVVSETEYPPAVPDMRAYLRERLPAAHLPTHFVIMKTLPLLPSGKVDRQSLPEPSEPAAGLVASAPPRDALETLLAGHWATVLGLPRVGVDDDFFGLGGHSLSAARLAGAVTMAGIGELSIRDILDHPTVAAQAALLLARALETDGAAHPPPPVPTGSGPRAEPGGADDAGFACPHARSPLFGRRACTLVMVLGREDDRDSFECVARRVEELDGTIRALVVADEPGWDAELPPRPTLVFSPMMLRHQPRIAAAVCCGQPLAKSAEYEALERAGIPVPRWAVLTEQLMPDLSSFGEYVVRKPDHGAKGAEIRIVRRDRVRWKPVVTSAAGPSPRLLVQEFVYTGPWPVSYRVNTLFGRVLYAMVITANTARAPLHGPTDFERVAREQQSASIVANARDSTAELCVAPEIIGFGERAARVFPDVPMLGVDILKDATTGALWVTEVNALGHNWNFTPEFARAFQLDIERQFGGLRKAAYVLAEETQRRAIGAPPPAVV